MTYDEYEQKVSALINYYSVVLTPLWVNTTFEEYRAKTESLVLEATENEGLAEKIWTAAIAVQPDERYVPFAALVITSAIVYGERM